MSKVHLCRFGRWLEVILIAFLINLGEVRAADYQRLLNINFGDGTRTGTAFIGNGTNDVWNLIGASDLSTTTNLVWANGTNSPLTLTISNLGNQNYIFGQSDEMLGSYIWSFSYNGELMMELPASITVSNLPSGNYALYCYSFGNDSPYENDLFTVLTETNSYGPKGTGENGYFDITSTNLVEDSQYVAFTNVVVGSDGVLTVALGLNTSYHVVNGLQLVDLDSTMQALPSVTFSPGTGAAVPTNVTMSVTGHGDATIYYTTNGTAPTTNSAVYSSPVSVSTALTVKAIATKTGYGDAPVATAAYVLPTLPSVSLTPSTGSEVPLSVTLSIAGHGDATIYYTTNGATPTTNSAVYSSAILLTVETTVRAFGTKAGYSNSAVASAIYYLPTATNPTISPSSGSYYVPLSVTISNSLSGADILYSTNGTTWNTYTSALAFTNNVVVRAKVVKTGYYDSATITNSYTVTPFPLPATSIEPNGGIFTNATTITLSNNVSGVLIEYQVGTNGTWSTYSAPFSMDGVDFGSGFLHVRVSKTNCVSHFDTSDAFLFVATPPIYSHAAGLYTNSFSLTLTNGTTGASMQYSLEGADWHAYSGPLTIDHNTTVYARTVKEGYLSNGHVGHRSWEGFSSTQGWANWYYLYTTEVGGLPDTFLPLYDTTNGVWRLTGDTNCNVGKLFQTPSSSGDSVRSFQAPYDGTVIISGLAFQDDLSSYENVMVRVLKNDDTILDWVYVSASTPLVLTVTNSLVANDEIHFQVSIDYGGSSHRLNFYPTINFQNYHTFTFTDTDGDGLSNAQEAAFGTNASNVDSDGDGVSDYIEWLLGRNPLVSGTTPDTGGLLKFKVFTPLE